MEDVRNGTEKIYEVTFASPDSFTDFINEPNIAVTDKDNTLNRVTVKIADKNINSLIRSLAKYEIASVTEIKMTLESYFLQFYREGTKNA
jgi:ABC-2 type transport system ATP-binding protein